MYDVTYFINKFEAIPSEYFITNHLVGYDNNYQHCALGHCGMESYDNPTDEALELVSLFGGSIDFISNHLDTEFNKVYAINDMGEGTPKKRILNYLYQIRDKQSVDAQTTYKECGEGLNEEDQLGE